MNFTKATYRTARSRAMNEVYSRADILEWARETQGRFMVDEARIEYHRAVERVTKIVIRGRREKGMGGDAEVTAEELTAHVIRKDEWRFKRLRVFEEVSDD